jgi:multicomponent Na+:H+ antiporter subunit D
MPLTMTAFFIGALSVIGLPPMGGTWSKWFLVMGAADAGQLALMGVLLVSSLLNVAYLLPIPIRAFFVAEPVKPHSTGHHDAGGVHEAPAFCVVPLCITAAGCVALFFLAPHLLKLLGRIVGGIA